MASTSILIPAMALAWWTCAILGLVAFRRLRPAERGGLFRFMERFAAGEPEDTAAATTAANRNWENLFESPVLFYLSCVILFVVDAVTALALWLAWTYYALRVMHSLVHVLYNRVAHRFMLFSLSIGVMSILMLQATLALF